MGGSQTQTQPKPATRVCRSQKPEAMGMQAASAAVAAAAAAAASSSFIYSLKWAAPNSAQIFVTASNKLPLKTNITKFPCLKFTNNRVKTRATLGERDDIAPPTPRLVQEEEQPNWEVEESVKILKKAAKTRKVAAEEILSALSVIEKAKIDPSGFLETLGGSESPGRTWMLIFTAEKKLKSGRYFPVTAVQRFDAAVKRIENGVYLGPIGCLTFEGRFSWKRRMLAFIFERFRIKVGPLKPLEIGFGQKDNREPSNVGKDPFFVWFYIDEEIAVARGGAGGTAFWCRCRRVTTSYSL